ncbi:MAG TPA: hydrogenase maturation protease [Symbiobacteriaceae bacterium]|nr:hydrogenase maturation protease [Symbiobacteriaceae bacterium]
MERRNPVLVLGIGNPIMTDDGAGIYAVRLAKSRWQGEGVDFLDAEVGGFDLLHYILGYKAALIVDVAVTGLTEPGDIYMIDTDALPPSLSTRAHGAGLGTALSVGRSLNLDMPARIEFLAIEAADISNVSEIPTTPVADAIRPAAEQILRLARQMYDEVACKPCMS